MNPSALQRLNRLAASVGIGFVMLVVGWWCLTIEPAAANGPAVESHPLPLTNGACVTVDGPVYEPTFDTGSRFGVATDKVSSLAVGDLDLDGDLDLVVGKEGEVVVHFNGGQGDFTSAPDRIVVDNQNVMPVIVSVADMSRDGALDIVMASQGQSGQVLVNDGRGKFSRIAQFGPHGSQTTTMTVGDLNGDAAFDIVAGYAAGPGVVYRNITPTTGIITPTFDISRPFGPPTGTMTSLAIGNLSTDDKPDIVAGYADGNLVVYWNDGLDRFPTDAKFTPLRGLGGSAMSLALVDLDGQHGLDIVAASIVAASEGQQPSVQLGIFLNKGQDRREFAAPSSICLTGTDTPVRLAAGDIDNDGRPDLVAGLGQPTEGLPLNFNRVFFNRSSGNQLKFERRNFGLAGRDNTQALAIADLDNNGGLDIITGNYSQQSLVFLNGGDYGVWPNKIRTGDVQIYSVAAGDVDGKDGPDIVASIIEAVDEPPIIVFANDGTGNYPITRSVGSVGVVARDVVLGDLNGDGKLDIVTATSRERTQESAELYNYVYVNDGTGSFAPNEQAGDMIRLFGSPSDNTQSLVLGDLNRDGYLDIVAGNHSSQNAVFLNDGSGYFTTTRELTFGPKDAKPSGMALGDIEGDGDLDVVVAYENRYSIIFFNNGQGSFDDQQSQEIGLLGIKTTGVALGDVDGDGNLDIVIGSLYNANHIYTNDGRGGFPATRAQKIGPRDNQTYDVALHDINGDGALDLVTGHWNRPLPNVVYLNDGNGNFNTNRTLQLRSVCTGPSVKQYTRGLALADANRDATVDVITGDRYSANCPETKNHRLIAYLIRNQSDAGLLDPVPTITIDQITQDAAHGTVVTYTLQDKDHDLVRDVGLYDMMVGSQRYFGEPLTMTLTDKPTTGVRFCLDAGSSTKPGQANCKWIRPNFFGALSGVTFRLQAFPNYRPQPYRIPGPYHWAFYATTTQPLDVSGRTIQVNKPAVAASDGTVVEDAVVYHLPKDKNRGAMPLADTRGYTYHPGNDGRLEGQGELHDGDRLMAIAPTTPNNWDIEATPSPLHYTSAPLIADTVTAILKPDMTVVSGATQTLTISQDNPLLLFDLAVALEWDARSDRQFMEQLSANLRRVSELLYDWSNGQAALGQITVYHDARAQARPDGTSPWSDADVRIFATNRLRPNSAQGGIVSRPITDPKPISVSTPITYVPGAVNIAASWNRYGDTTGNLGEDWPRALAHELGHYLFFLNDNYIGVDDQGLLVPVSGCAGVMADPYQTDDENGYGEYHAAGEAWQEGCAQTLSYIETGRSDWETITLFYPWLKAPPRDPANDQVSVIQSGPDVLPIEVTQLSEIAPVTPTTALEHPVFYLVEGESTDDKSRQTPFVELQPAAGARAFLFKSKPEAPRKYDRVVDLGRPRLDQVLARGAQPGDLLCVTDPEHRRAGCSDISAAGNNEVKLSTLPEAWQPDVVITPVITRTPTVTVTGLQVIVTGLPAVDLEGQLFPLDGRATEKQPFSANGTTYSTTFTLTDTVPSGHLVLLIHDGQTDHPDDRQTDDRPIRLVTDLTLGGSPAFVHGKVVHAPVLSNDGQVLLYGPDLNLKNDQVALLHAVTRVPQPPSWATVIGNAYRLATSPGVDLTGTSLSFSYLGNEVPTGEEGALNVYRWNDNESWERLETVRNPAQNVASAAINKEGLYALMSSTEIPLPHAGWNLFGYPVPLPVTRTVTEALAGAGIDLTVAFGFDPGNPSDPWQVYVPGAPADVSDLRVLTFGHGYFIHTPVPGTLRFKGVSPFADSTGTPTAMSVTNTSDLALLTPPAIVYGKLDIADQAAVSGTMSITATINGSACGHGKTFTNSSETWYAVKIQAASETSPTCGLVNRPVTLILATADGDRTLTPPPPATVTWDNAQPQAITMTLHSADTSPKTPTANCTELVTNGGFESPRGWRLERTANRANYTTSLAHEGTSSLQLGLTPADPSRSRGDAISSGYQFVRIPPTAPSARLSFWYHTDAPTQGGDHRRVLLLNDSFKPLKELVRLPAATDAWQEASFDLAPYKGRNVGIYFETYNDNTASAPRTWMAIDDVSLTVCR